MQFEVPQFIEVEDKIIGPFTWKQFVYLAGGAGMLVVGFFVLPFFIFILLAIPVGALSAFLAFHKVNSRPFSIFLESFLRYFTGTRMYFWKKEEEQTVIRGDRPSTLSNPVEYTQKKQLSSLSRKLDLTSIES